MHAERLGIRPDVMAGELTDSFLVDQDAESSVILHVVIRSPGEGELPLRTPKEFDLSGIDTELSHDNSACPNIKRNDSVFCRHVLRNNS